MTFTIRPLVWTWDELRKSHVAEGVGCLYRIPDHLGVVLRIEFNNGELRKHCAMNFDEAQRLADEHNSSVLTPAPEQMELAL